jgi:hypothetical protein
MFPYISISYAPPIQALFLLIVHQENIFNLNRPVYRNREGYIMKKIWSKMKVLFVLAICVGLVVPAIVSAAEKTVILVNGAEFSSGDYTIPENYLKSSQNITLKENINKLEFVVVNGDSSGKSRLSSARIELLDNDGNPISVAITPDQLNQNVSKAIGTLGKDDLAGLTDIKLDLKLRGPKRGFITLYVTEFYEADEDCPWWDFSCR